MTRPDSGVPSFDVRIEREDDRIVLRLTGEFDLAAMDDFEAGVEDALSAPLSELVLDLRGLRFVDSTGLRGILTVWETSQQDCFALSVLRGPPEVQRTFTITSILRDQTERENNNDMQIGRTVGRHEWHIDSESESESD